MQDAKYSCFKFNEKSYFDQYVGPAYKDDITEDIRNENGLNSTKSIVMKVKVIKIRGLINETVDNYWYNPESGVVYDYDLNYPVGKIKKDLEGIPQKIDKETYEIELILIPNI